MLRHPERSRSSGGAKDLAYQLKFAKIGGLLEALR
jgi:hypothetical protein